jgi:two-component system sensor histidine kinase HupT/HoxJ
LGQVVLNLVVNAADALTGQADPMPRIDVSVGEKDGWGWVQVRDNGPGIPDHKAQSIFEPFVTSKIGKGGTGLGLAVSQTIAEEHGGTLMLEPHDGLGAWFQLRLPLA